MGPAAGGLPRESCPPVRLLHPGILLAAADLLGRGGPPTRIEIAELLSGHICRCTGYAPIVEAIAQAADAR